MDNNNIVEKFNGILEADKHPWRTVTNRDVKDAIKNTCLHKIIENLSYVTDPPLLLESTLPKAIVLMAVALSGRKENASHLENATARGDQLARLRIMTGGGQVCNAYALEIAPSGTCKDLGNRIVDEVIHGRKLYLAMGGSAEGLLDGYIAKPNGLITVSELGPWLDKRHWQYKAAEILTLLFNKGWFSYNFSEKSKSVKTRESNYCYPNVIASIQPDVLERKAGSLDVSSGFLGRFLITRIDSFTARPRNGDIRGKMKEGIDQCLDVCIKKEGDVSVPENYLSDLMDMFDSANVHPNLKSTYKRYVNEYGPRLAVMVSIMPDDDSTKINLTKDSWNKARILIKWFFTQAEKVLSNITDMDDRSIRRKKITGRIHELIHREGLQGISKMEISRNTGYESVFGERDDAIKELLDKGYIKIDNKIYFSTSVPD